MSLKEGFMLQIMAVSIIGGPFYEPSRGVYASYGSFYKLGVLFMSLKTELTCTIALRLSCQQRQ